MSLYSQRKRSRLNAIPGGSNSPEEEEPKRYTVASLIEDLQLHGLATSCTFSSLMQSLLMENMLIKVVDGVLVLTLYGGYMCEGYESVEAGDLLMSNLRQEALAEYAR